MKTFLKIILGIVVVIGILVSLAFYATGDLAEAGEKFFVAVGAGNIDEAKSYLSEDFRAATPDEAFVAFLEKSALKDAASVSWNNRSYSGNQGELEGVVTTKSGGTIPISLKLVKENDAWKIYNIQKSVAGLQEKPSDGSPIPNIEEAGALVVNTTVAFGEAINKKDYSDFHKTLAIEFQEQVPLEKFNSVFSSFVEQGIDLTPLKNSAVQFSENPSLSSQGVLLLEGFFPTTPSRLLFSYKYIKRSGEWKLLGLNLNLKPIE